MILSAGRGLVASTYLVTFETLQVDECPRKDSEYEEKGEEG